MLAVWVTSGQMLARALDIDEDNAMEVKVPTCTAEFPTSTQALGVCGMQLGIVVHSWLFLPATEQTSHLAEFVVSGSGGAVVVICAFASGRDA